MLNSQDTLSELKDYMLERLTSLKGVTCEILRDEICLTLPKGGLISALKLLRDDNQTKFSQLSDITAVDWPQNAPRFCLVYHLLSHLRQTRLRIKIWVEDGEIVPSCHEIWPAANWYEREIWDMYGLSFSNHPDLRRILTDYGFEGHPQRKDFPLTGYVELRYDAAKRRCVYEPVNLTQDFRNFDFLSPWEAMTKQASIELKKDDKVNESKP